jgi:hypothetical protein
MDICPGRCCNGLRRHTLVKCSIKVQKNVQIIYFIFVLQARLLPDLGAGNAKY